MERHWGKSQVYKNWGENGLHPRVRNLTDAIRRWDYHVWGTVHKYNYIQYMCTAYLVCLYTDETTTLGFVLSYIQVSSEHMNANGFLEHYCDGKVYKKHSLYQQHPNALQLNVYYDDVEVCNPLGSKRKIHKLGKVCVYIMCCTHQVYWSWQSWSTGCIYFIHINFISPLATSDRCRYILTSMWVVIILHPSPPTQV